MNARKLSPDEIRELRESWIAAHQGNRVEGKLSVPLLDILILPAADYAETDSMMDRKLNFREFL